jgi:hypothetical protein
MPLHGNVTLAIIIENKNIDLIFNIGCSCYLRRNNIRPSASISAV